MVFFLERNYSLKYKINKKLLNDIKLRCPKINQYFRYYH